MVCLESDFLIGFSRKLPEALAKMRLLVEAGESLFVTPITVTELFVGAFYSKDPEELLKSEEIVSTLKLLEYDFYAAKTAAEIMAALAKKGEKIGDMDTLTAGIALRHNENTIVTRNKKHFAKIAGLKVERW